jgi:hypothetical protein
MVHQGGDELRAQGEPMQCVICVSAERLRVAAGRTDGSVVLASRSAQIVCSRCGGPLAAGALKDRVVAKLAQLARFGLLGTGALFGAERQG